MILEFDTQNIPRPQIRQPAYIRHLARESIRGLSRSVGVSHCAVRVVALGEGYGACGVGQLAGGAECITEEIINP